MSMRSAIALALISAASVLCISNLSAQKQPANPYVRFPAPPKAQAGIKSLVGEVVNAQGAKLPQAVVHLKDKKTLAVETRISDDQGKYVFRGLDREADYEVHAEYQGVSSPSKNVSHFDDRDEINLTLEVPSK
jgi:Carboxypeptidase regulatory-like domain